MTETKNEEFTPDHHLVRERQERLYGKGFQELPTDQKIAVIMESANTVQWYERYAVAESWASMDGRLEAFRGERGLGINEFAGYAGFTGHYAAYMEKAAEMIERLAARGYKIVPIAENPHA